MAELTLREAEERTGLHNKTLRRYIKSGKIQASLTTQHNGWGEYHIEESELAKLPKPYKKHGVPVERKGVPQGPPPTAPVPFRVTILEGTPEQIERYRRLERQSA